ncbi:MAG: hypothetical protein Kow0040_27330 [Thermogutta sp.]
METVKTIAVLAVLLVVGYLGYQAVTKPPKAPEPAEESSDWSKGGNLDIAVPQVPMELAGQGYRNMGDSSASEPAVPPAAIAGSPGISGRAESAGSGSDFVAAQPRDQVGRFAPMDSASVATQGLSQGNASGEPMPQQAGTLPFRSSNSSAFPEPTAGPQNAQAPTSDGEVRKEFAEFLETARQKLDQGEFATVHEVLSVWFADGRLTREEDAQLTDLLDQVAGTVVYSPQSILDPPHIVASGETLGQIAERYAVPWRLLAKINGISQPEQLVPGQSLKVIRGPFQARLYLSRGELVLFVQNRYAGRFPVTLGADATATPGVYRVCEKIEDPSYYTPTGVASPGDAANPLGRLWIGLGGRLGIHGPGRADLSQQSKPPGAFILSEKDIRDVYDILSIGSEVAIIP